MNGEVSFAGRHLLLELWEAQGLDQVPLVEKALTDAVTACKATLLVATHDKRIRARFSRRLDL